MRFRLWYYTQVKLQVFMSTKEQFMCLEWQYHIFPTWIHPGTSYQKKCCVRWKLARTGTSVGPGTVDLDPEWEKLETAAAPGERESSCANQGRYQESCTPQQGHDTALRHLWKTQITMGFYTLPCSFFGTFYFHKYVQWKKSLMFIVY